MSGHLSLRRRLEAHWAVARLMLRTRTARFAFVLAVTLAVFSALHLVQGQWDPAAFEFVLAVVTYLVALWLVRRAGTRL